MSPQEQIECQDYLKKVVNETSGTALTISPKEEKWTGYLLQQKQSFEGKTVGEVCKAVADHIVANRVENPSQSKGKRIVKPFKYSA